MFFLGSLFLTLLVGVLIPSTFIAASPQEYVDVTYFHNPLWYIVSSGCMAAGTFLVWLRVFYWLASNNGKVIFDKLVWIICGLMLVNYMFFGTDLGVVSSTLQYSNDVVFSRIEQLINLVILAVIAFIMYFVLKKWSRFVAPILLTAVVAFGAMSTINVVKIKRSVEQISKGQNSGEINFTLSKEGKNVVVIMLDRAIGAYVPYFLNEKPELKEQFAGFTYYSNTISFGGHTNMAVPALLGGYEYTPVEINKRDDESLASKHNEALKVMPVLFAENGYDVTMCDPPYANYQWIPDLSLFDDYSNVKAYNTKGAFTSQEQKQQTIRANYRNFFCFSIMKSMPLCMQPTIYHRGTYNQAYVTESNQVMEGLTFAEGKSTSFMDSYNVLNNLPNITNISDDDNKTFLFMCNEVTHEPMMLQEPEYVPSDRVDNTEFYVNKEERFNLDGRTIAMNDQQQIRHYQSNMCALLQLGQWFDFLREQDVYDNTRIIIVSDHGLGLYQFDELMEGAGENNYKDVETYYPLLLVKDFNSTEFTESEEFMTNADVPMIAVQELIENPTNPYTGKVLDNSEKTAHDQYVIMSDKWDIVENNGNVFLPSEWASVKDNLWNKSNWKFIEEEIVLDEHKLP